MKRHGQQMLALYTLKRVLPAGLKGLSYWLPVKADALNAAE